MPLSAGILMLYCLPEWMNTFKCVMEGNDVVNRDSSFGFTFGKQNFYAWSNLFRFCGFMAADSIGSFLVIPNGKPYKRGIFCAMH